MSTPTQSDSKPRTSNLVWLGAGCIIAVVVIACIAAVAVGWFFYSQAAAKPPAMPTSIVAFGQKTPTLGLPPTQPPPAETLVPPTIVTSSTAPPTQPPTLAASLTRPPTSAVSPTQPSTADVIPSRTASPTVAPTLPPPIVLPPCPPAYALPSGMLHCEDFASKEIAASRGWYFGTGPNVDYTWSPNRFTVAVKPKDWMGYSWANGDYDNFGAEIEAQPVGDDYAEYGLAFRITGAEDVRNYYSIGITSDGKYFMFKKIAGKWSDVSPVERTPTPLVRTGKSKNLIGVIAQGNTFALYINRVLVNTITDNALAKGAVGVHAGTDKETTNAVVAFSRLTVLTPDKARAEWAAASLSTQPTPAVPPGLYVSALRLEPGPKRGVDITFYPTFLNTTGGTQTYRVRVYLYRAENLRNSFGETSAAPIAIPVGSTEQKALGFWRLSGGGGCEDFIARVGWIDEQNRITFFNAPEGGTFESRFPVCP